MPATGFRSPLNGNDVPPEHWKLTIAGQPKTVLFSSVRESELTFNCDGQCDKVHAKIGKGSQGDRPYNVNSVLNV